ncbi:hypothetical protein QU487_23580 [Crenobacter sp. SG2305]|uniref:hypothetical protein n=1 Tax=Crenobacter oryzisoli TaxID=3056844 RepID=UPI0025AB1B4A|nr:hypothetical protein [Crenobacter sp. SG2305]MDN0085675.1 hypothetical protein [Crenobacter sp. SG2305]
MSLAEGRADDSGDKPRRSLISTQAASGRLPDHGRPKRTAFGRHPSQRDQRRADQGEATEQHHRVYREHPVFLLAGGHAVPLEICSNITIKIEIGQCQTSGNAFNGSQLVKHVDISWLQLHFFV